MHINEFCRKKFGKFAIKFSDFFFDKLTILSAQLAHFFRKFVEAVKRSPQTFMLYGLC